MDTNDVAGPLATDRDWSEDSRIQTRFEEVQGCFFLNVRTWHMRREVVQGAIDGVGRRSLSC